MANVYYMRYSVLDTVLSLEHRAGNSQENGSCSHGACHLARGGAAIGVTSAMKDKDR